MDRRERMLGIAEKLPKSRATTKSQPAKAAAGVTKPASAKPATVMAARRPVMAPRGAPRAEAALTDGPPSYP